LRTVEDVEKYFPEFKAFIDITEQQEIQRPKDNMRLKKSTILVKRKERHTVKMQYMVNKEGEIYCINQIITKQEEDSI
jgi:hypothetical protein